MKKPGNRQIVIIAAVITAFATILSAIIVKWPDGSNKDDALGFYELGEEIRRLRGELKLSLPDSEKKQLPEDYFLKQETKALREQTFIAAATDAIRNICEDLYKPIIEWNKPADHTIFTCSCFFPPSLHLTSQSDVEGYSVTKDIIVLTFMEGGVEGSIVVNNFCLTGIPSNLDLLTFQYHINRHNFSVIGSDYYSDGTLEVTVAYKTSDLSRFEVSEKEIIKHVQQRGAGGKVTIHDQELTISESGIALGNLELVR